MKTSSSKPTISPRASAQDGFGASWPLPEPPRSPALSTASTADGEDDFNSSPIVPSLPVPLLPDRALRLLRTPPPQGADEIQFGTASWGSPYPQAELNLQRQSYNRGSSDEEEEEEDDEDEDDEVAPVHTLAIDTPFLRPVPVLLRAQTDTQPTVSPAAAVLANRVRRQTLGLTEDWIRTHTTDDFTNSESRHWFSDGSETESEPSSLSGSEHGWLDEQNLRTPRAVRKSPSTSREVSRHYPRARSSVETLKPGDSLSPKIGQNNSMETSQASTVSQDATSVRSQLSTPSVTQEQLPPPAPPKDDVSSTRSSSTAPTTGEVKRPTTPPQAAQKPLPKAPAMTPRIKKKVPWKGKNIIVLLPRDEERGKPGQPPFPLRQDEIGRMFDSWEELGYDISGFDLEVEGYQPEGTHDSQSRDAWPNFEEVAQEKEEQLAKKNFQVTLPDLNAWKNYVNELQEAKLRALGVSFGDDEPEAPSSISPDMSNPSRQPSAQYPQLPFSPPLPTSSATSNPGVPGFPFPGGFAPGRSSANQSPGLPGASPVPFGGVPGKFNPRQSISFPASSSPFQMPPQHSPQGWPHQPGMLPGMNRLDSPSLMTMNGIMSPQSPFGEFPGAGSPAFNMHQRHQSLQYPMLPHQQHFQQPLARASPRLQEVREDEEDLEEKTMGKTPDSLQQNPDALQAEIDDAEYHLEEQFRNQLEHEDYNPHLQPESNPTSQPFIPVHDRQMPNNFPVPERFANEPAKPLVLHHPRPHSRGHSLTQQNFYHDENGNEVARNKFGKLNEIPEAHKSDEAYEIETNPSNLGTPVQNFDFTQPPFGQHQKTLSSVSNPWTDSVSNNKTRRTSHESKPSLSKLNVQAPEFKFNPTSSFTPGQFNFSSNSFQPGVFQASTGNSVASPTSNPLSEVTPSKINAAAPAFSPGQSDFSFSMGAKFNPDAQSFTPFQSISGSVNSPPASGAESVGTHGSIFGSIDIKADEVVKPSKKSKAVPIIIPDNEAPPADTLTEDADGRLVDESRFKRARSSARDGDDVPLFAQQPKDEAHMEPVEESQVEQPAKDEHSTAEDETALQGDTSLSSVVTSDQMDTKETTAAPSETSPAEQHINRWGPFEFESKLDVQSFNDARPFGEDNFKHSHEKTLSATAAPFTPGVLASSEPEQRDEDVDYIEDTPVPEDLSAGLGISRFASPPQPKASAKGLGASRFADPPKTQGLGASRYADESFSEEPSQLENGDDVMESVEQVPEEEAQFIATMGATASPAFNENSREPTFEEIDAVMQDMKNNPSKFVNKYGSATKWLHHSPGRKLSTAAVAHSSPYRLDPGTDEQNRDEASLTPRDYHLPDPNGQPSLNDGMEDPFIDPPQTHDFEGESLPASDWEAAFTEDEHDKLQSRAQFFDGRVNEVVGHLLASRLSPLEKSIYSIENALAARGFRPVSSRREMRSMSAELQHSDADDEDEEPIIRRSMSPRRDRRLDQIRIAVMDAMATQRSQPGAPGFADSNDNSVVLKALEEMKQSIGTSMASSNDFKAAIEDAVERRMATSSQAADSGSSAKVEELQAKILDLEQRLFLEQSKCEKEIADRRAVEEVSAELNRKLQGAESRVEAEIINRSVFDSRVADLEERLRAQEERSDAETLARRAAEDRLSENQRLLRIASEEENCLREVVEERDQRILSLEQAGGKTAMRMALLEATANNSTHTQSEMSNKINILETDLRNVRQDNHHWRTEAERADDAARQRAAELSRVVEDNQNMQKTLLTMSTQLQENERLRESWRGKFMSLQEDMSKAAREIAEETAQRIKKEQSMLARQEVLDARLQAEAKTRERLEVELDRLQTNERTGIRAFKECERLEGLLAEMKTENHKLQQKAMRYQLEFEEARESGASEVKRTRMALQTEVDSANNQVNVIREELEEQNSKLRAELDHVRLEADTAKAQNEMLLEEAHNSKTTELSELQRKHQNEIEDLETRYERQVSNAQEDAQKAEQHLLERLSLSTSRTEHLQDRILHLEDKLEIAKQAAAAAAQAAKAAGVEPGSAAIVGQPRPVAPRSLDVPEKISPQALRESIMVLQEQLQAREQRIEELEQTVAKADPDAATKITKRDDEISWLRELLAVRHENLQDIITALSGDGYNRDAVKDAAIRLKANLQMEEQERERAMNGGSAISLPNIAQSIQAATPRVAQRIGPIAAAWGNWRKGSQPTLSSLSSVLSSPAPGRNATPSKNTPSPNPQNSRLSGLMTPPASGLRQTPTVEDNRPQPTAFSSTGRRFTSQSNLESRPRVASNASHRTDKMPAPGTPPRKASLSVAQPLTPPMMHQGVYDSDAQPGDFDDHDFFEDD